MGLFARTDIASPLDGASVHPAIVRRIVPPPSLTPQQEERVTRLVQSGLTPRQAEFAIRREIRDPERYLQPISVLPSYPFPLLSTENAFGQLLRHQKTKEPVAIASDFDADGVCAAAILATTLRGLEIPVVVDTPCRQREGYGVNRRIIDEAVKQKCTTLFLLDFGTTQHQMIQYAAEQGLRVIVIDHHQLGHFSPPSQCLILNPHIRGEEYQEMCAAGLTFAFCDALLSTLPHQVNRDHLAILAAVATIADVVPLEKANIDLVRYGLTVLSAHPGLRALAEEAGLPTQLSSADIAFQVGPLFNAPGRILPLGARQVVQLLLGTEAEQRTAAIELVYANEQRKEREQLDYQRALEIVGREPLPAGLFVASDSFDPGVAGLVASRLSERYARPVVVVACITPRTGRGSVRGAPGFHVHGALQQCSRYFERFGGHKAAGGLTIRREHIADAAAAFAEEVQHQIGALPIAAIESDLRSSLAELVQNPRQIADEFEIFEPYGNGKIAPRIYLERVRISDIAQVGTEHLRCVLGSNGSSMTAYLWRGVGSEFASLNGTTANVVVHLSRFLKQGAGQRSHTVALQILGWEKA